MIYLPAILPESTTLFSKDPKQDYISVNNFANNVIDLMACKYGILITSEGSDRCASIQWAMVALAVELGREMETPRPVEEWGN